MAPVFLTRLGEVDWSDAPELPPLLRAVADGAVDARAALRDGLVSVDRLHAGSAKAVPCLVELLLLRKTDPGLVTFVFELLSEMTSDPSQWPLPMDPDAVFAPLDADDDDEADEADDLDYLRRWRDCYVALERELPSLVPFVEAPDEEVALAAIDLVSAFPYSREQSIPVLERLFTSTLERAGAAAIAIARLAGPEARAMAEEMLASDDARIATYGACAAVLVSDTIFDDQIVSLLAFPLPDDDLAETFYEALLERDLAGVIAALCRLLQDSDAGDDETAFRLTELLFATLFGAGPAPSPPSKLTAMQRTALAAICARNAFASPGYADLLEERDLPTDRTELLRSIGIGSG